MRGALVFWFARRPSPVGVVVPSDPVGVEGRLEGVSGSSEPELEGFVVMLN